MQQEKGEIMSTLRKYIIVFFISMVPLIELRGAIPVAIDGYHLPVIASFIICIIGNMLPVPIIYLFAHKVLIWGLKVPVFCGFCRFCLKKGKKAGEKLVEKAGRGTFIALCLFVGIPLPGTGAWTGTLGASILGLSFKETVAACMCGVILAGCIMMFVSYGAQIIF